MRELYCSASTCVHNDKMACKRDVIKVEKQKEAALCRDYKPIGSVNYTYETARERCLGTTSFCHSNIHCLVKECQFYNDERCSADKVRIEDNATYEMGKVKCKTYKPRNKFD